MFKKLTHIEVAQLWQEREALFKEQVVDLKDNEEIDSSGVAFLVQWAKSQNNKLTICHASETVRSLIKTFRLEPLFVLQD